LVGGKVFIVKADERGEGIASVVRDGRLIVKREIHDTKAARGYLTAVGIRRPIAQPLTSH
jgi:hypothetical protein